LIRHRSGVRGHAPLRSHAGQDHRYAATRDAAIAPARGGARSTRLRLVGTKGRSRHNLEFLQRVLGCAEFAAGQYDTSLAEKVVERA